MTARPERRGRVAVFVGTRADLGPLLPVIEALDDAEDLEVHVLTGVMYSAGTLAEILSAGPAAEPFAGRVHALADPMGSVSVDDMLQHGPEVARGAARVLRELTPDVVVVLGDRWELLHVVPQMFLAGVPVVHLHGGEVTEGAVDERVRHAVTKLADQHCVASEDAARRLRQMGEPADRVHVTGAPGLDRLAAVSRLDDEELGGMLGLEVVRPVALFTYHPLTAEASADVGRWAAEALAACVEVCGTVVATHPGMDAGREHILAVLADAAHREPRVVVAEALGRDYPRVLASVDVVVGNSSSGIIEAATVGLPVINIGDRQRGRLRGANVIDVGEGYDGVRQGLELALAPAFVEAAAGVVNPYGRGDAAQRVVGRVRAAAGSSRVKPFIDFHLDIQPEKGPRDQT